MQLTELEMLMLLWMAGGRGTTPVGTGVGCTGGWACGRASRLSDRSLNGSIFEGDSSLAGGTPLGFTWRETARSQNHTPAGLRSLPTPPELAFCLTALVGGRHTGLENKEQLSVLITPVD